MRPSSHIELNEIEKKELEKAVKSNESATVRKRAESVLLNSRGYSLQEVADIFDVERHAVGRWLAKWKSLGIKGLQMLPGRGRKPFSVTVSVEEKKKSKHS